MQIDQHSAQLNCNLQASMASGCECLMILSRGSLTWEASANQLPRNMSSKPKGHGPYVRLQYGPSYDPYIESYVPHVISTCLRAAVACKDTFLAFSCLPCRLRVTGLTSEPLQKLNC